MENITDDVSDWRKAGAIAATALRYGRDMIKPGAKMLEVLDAVEKKIFELGGEIGFPAQMSFGDVAAHDCADPDDDREIPETVVKMDVGVSVNGAIGDNAWTVDLTGEHAHLLKASQNALKVSIETAKVGVEIGKVGKAIQDAMEAEDCIPISNLSGHGIARYKVHTSPSMPNYDNKNPNKLQKGMIVAIEPFSTTGTKGLVRELERANIFMQVGKRPVRSPMTRDILKVIQSYNGLPFTTRYLTKQFPKGKVNFALKDLMKNEIIRAYPPLREESGGMVAQFENTLYIGDETEVLTKPLKGHSFDEKFREFI
ncbi:MAG: type II methionyl aminopeptidase [Candidatus Nanoarchaeia archaeon]